MISSRIVEKKQPRLMWKFKIGEIYSNSPTVTDGIVYFGSECIVALDSITGKVRWQVEKDRDFGSDCIDFEVFDSPVIANNTAFFSIMSVLGEGIYALDSKTGQFKYHWAESGLYTIHASDYFHCWRQNGDIVIIFHRVKDDSLYYFAPFTLKTKWWDEGYLAITDDKDLCYYSFTGDLCCFANLSLDFLHEAWAFYTGYNGIIDGRYDDNEDDEYYDGFFYWNVEGTIFAGNGNFYEEEPQIIWEFQREDISHPSIVVAEDIVCLFERWSSDRKQLYVIDSQTGQEKWKFGTENSAISDPNIVDGTVFFGNGRYLYAFDSQTGREKWKFETEGIVEGPAVTNDAIYFASTDGYLYALEPPEFT